MKELKRILVIIAVVTMLVMSLAACSKDLKNEKVVETIHYKGAVFEIVERDETLWVGTLAYGDEEGNEPSWHALLLRYQWLAEDVPKLDCINPDWDALIRVNYFKNQEPLGAMYAQEINSSEEQDERYDIFTQPGGLYMKIFNDTKAAALLGKEQCDNWDLILYIAETAAPENGYRLRENTDLAVEYHNYTTDEYYVYVPVEKV